MIDAGELTTPAKTELTIEDFADPIPIEGLSEPIPAGHQPTRLMLEDATGQGVLVNGTVNIHDDGSGEVVITDDKEFPKPLRTPIKVYGNLIEATRGETVRDEVLGSGDAQQAFQSFTLAKKPLTYLHDPTGPNQRRSTLEVRVNGIKWREEPSFFGTTPTDEIYIVRQNSEGESVITFGDGTYGARLPSGVDNVVATYRFGAGAAVPPAGSITQLVKPVEGLRRVRNPVQAGGGADGDRSEDIRRNAPTAALTLGRAVSTQDFEALARQYGVLNAQVEWGWDKPSQRAAVMVWYIPSGGTSKPSELRRSLRGQTDPNVPIRVTEAKRVYFDLTLEVEHDDRTPPDQVAAGVHEALFHPDTGLLAPRNVSIGRPIFRSRVVEAASAVEGVVAVKRISGMPLSNSELRERDLPEADEDAAEWYVESQAFKIATGTYPYFLDDDINISATRGQP
jgi:predicted phage baseplate assembly protein